MDPDRFDTSPAALAISGRRGAVRALAAATTALLTAAGLTNGAAAKPNRRKAKPKRHRRDPRQGNADKGLVAAGPADPDTDPPTPDGTGQVEAEAKRGKPGPPGPTGPIGPIGPIGPSGGQGVTGPTGPAVPAGPVGVNGRAGVVGWEMVLASSEANSATPKDVTVRCTGLKRVGGGGYEVAVGASDSIHVTHNYPSSGNSWRVIAHDGNIFHPTWGIRAYAICAEA